MKTTIHFNIVHPDGSKTPQTFTATEKHINLPDLNPWDKVEITHIESDSDTPFTVTTNVDPAD